MRDLLERLRPIARRGSKPRCHLLTHGSHSDVAIRLTELAEPWVEVGASDKWFPQGFNTLDEAQLHKADLLPLTTRMLLRDWWLVVARQATTPTFDIASTCTVNGKFGLLLVEAKAHHAELEYEMKGKRPASTPNGRRNHDRIGRCIDESSIALSAQTGLNWSLARDRCYQLSNRFALAWKLTQLGIPVVLIYLGFLQAEEMRRGRRLFVDHAEWDAAVRTHSAGVVDDTAWNRPHNVGGETLVPLIRSMELPLSIIQPAASTPSRTTR